MEKEEKKQQSRNAGGSSRLQRWVQAAAVTCYTTVLFAQPAAAADTLWTRFSSIMSDVYGELVGISTIVAVTAAAVALLVRMISRNERAVAEATSWLKRIVVTWLVLNTLGFAVGVLCYTSPLAYSMGASKATSRVFQSWCRMVGSQLLLLVLNVWFLRAFNSSVGQFNANGGALTTGQGNIFLWIFCALALLKIAQKCDSYLAAMGLSVAQTGSSMGVEMLMAARALTGFSKGGGSSASSVFGGAAKGGANAAAGAAGGVAAGGILSGFMNRYKPNSFVRDAVVDGGSRMGAGGSVGFVGRVFGGMAARNGATLTPDSVSSVAIRPPNVSGTIGGEIADRSLAGYMPQMANGAAAGMTYSGTQITGGHISTTATGPDGRQAKVDLYSAAQHDVPNTPHTVVSAADGSQWYQVASGDGMGAFYAAPGFTGDSSEAAQIAEAFPSAPEGTLLRQVDEGTMEANYPDGGNALWYNSAYYQEPDAPHETIRGADGLSWYAMTPASSVPQFEPEMDSGSSGSMSMPDASGSAAEYNQALFGQFMPGFDQPVVSVDGSRAGDGVLEVRHEDGAGTAFYDRAIYQAPRGDYHVFEDSGGGQWYAIPGTPTVERRPVYEDGKAVYDGDKLQTVNVETMRYKTTPMRYSEPKKRPVNERKAPNRKKP